MQVVPESKGGVTAAVVKFDALANAVGSSAQNQHLQPAPSATWPDLLHSCMVAVWLHARRCLSGMS